MFIECKNLSRVYHINDIEIKAVDNISLEIEKGDYTALTGQSGSGKSTLLHMLGGIDRPSNGNIFIDSEDISTMPENELAVFRRRKIGLIYQFYNLIPYLTVEMNIRLPLMLDKRVCDEEEFKSITAMCGLSDRLSHLPEQLSGGQQQRVAIARTLLQRPALMLADEPTGNLDSHNAGEVLELFRRANETYGQTIVIVTHDADVASEALYVLHMKDGKLV